MLQTKRVGRMTIRQTLAAIALLFVSISAGAVEVGNLEIKSGLGDPLRASIPLDQLGGLTSEQLKVRSATTADFAAMGIEQLGGDTFVSYEVFLDGAGKGVVLVTTERAVSEPFINLLVEFVWPGGRVVREFPVLLDP